MIDLKEIPHIHQVDTGNYARFREVYSPVVILNTGRAGSGFVHYVLSGIRNVHSVHEGYPNLMMLSNDMFHQSDISMSKLVFRAAREEVLLEQYLVGKVYVESNHCLVPYIKAISALFPSARFVHLIRSPIGFIQSAIRKGWFANDTIWENNRVSALDEGWNGNSQVTKLAKYWSIINERIHDDLNNIENLNVKYHMEDLSNDINTLQDFIKFIVPNTEVAEDEIERLQATIVNAANRSSKDSPAMKRDLDFILDSKSEVYLSEALPYLERSLGLFNYT